MIVVDSSVWIDWFAGVPSRQVEYLDYLVDEEVIGLPDLVIVEVLQGCDSDGQFRKTLDRLSRHPVLDTGGAELAVQAARNYRLLRAKGITIRKTIDTLIATRCILDDIPLLYSDRDFDPFVEHLNLQSALPPPTKVN